MQEITFSKEELFRNEVITTAQKLFQRYGFQKTTMEDIAKAMGKGKSTLYYYYKSKESIFGDVILQEAQEVNNATKASCAAADTAQEKLYSFMNSFFTSIKSKVSLYDVIKKEIIESGSLCINQPEIHDSVKALEKQQRDLLISILKFGIEASEFSKKIVEDIDLIAQVIIIGLQGFIVDFAFEEEKSAISTITEDKMKAMVNILIYGLK